MAEVKETRPLQTTAPTDTPPVKLLDEAQLQTGDVLLERGAGASAALIATVTRGAFSHALIYVGGGDVIEAMPDGGVRNLGMHRVPILDSARWRLMRVRETHRAEAALAATLARGMIAKEYDMAGALRTTIGGRAQPEPGQLFCSQLVAEAYRIAGLDLAPGRCPEAITPNDLARSPSLERCELPLVAYETLGRGPYPTAFLDRSQAHKDSALRGHLERDRWLFDQMRPLWTARAVPRGTPPPGNLSELIHILPGMRSDVANTVASEMLSLMVAVRYFDDLQAPLEGVRARIAAGHDCAREVPGWRQTLGRHQTNAEICFERHRQWPHPLWSTLRDFYLDLAISFAELIVLAERRPESEALDEVHAAARWPAGPPPP